MLTDETGLKNQDLFTTTDKTDLESALFDKERRERYSHWRGHTVLRHGNDNRLNKVGIEVNAFSLFNGFA